MKPAGMHSPDANEAEARAQERIEVERAHIESILDVARFTADDMTADQPEGLDAAVSAAAALGLIGEVVRDRDRARAMFQRSERSRLVAERRVRDRDIALDALADYAREQMALRIRAEEALMLERAQLAASSI